VLVKSVGTLDLNADTVADFDAANIHFAGQSLGGIAGTTLAAQNLPAIKSAYLNVPGGGIANLIVESVSLAPRVNAGLAASGLTPGTSLYAQFFRDAQTLVDAGDPVNYAAAAATARPVLFTQVVNDTVVPNTATQRLVAATAATRESTAGLKAVAAGNAKWVHFLSGSHSSLLDPTASLAVTTEMQSQAVSLVVAGGGGFAITNPALLQQ